MHRRDVVRGLAALAGAVGAGSLAPAADSPEFEAILSRWDRDDHPDLKGVVVRVAGRLVAERYFNDEKPDELHDMRSAGKSITSLLVGAARDRGLIHSLRDPVERYLPEARGSAIGDVSLADVLTMRSGLAAIDSAPESPGNEDRLDEAKDPLAFLFGVPRAVPPGSLYQYNSLTAYTAGLVVERAAKMPEQDFARSALFAPIGIERVSWATDIAGHTKGQGNLSITARDMARIGQMMLDGGQFEGKRVVSAEWVAESLTPRVNIGSVDPYADGYGYFWYTKTLSVGGEKVKIHFASGNGGNKIYIVPSRHWVVAITSSAYNRGYGQRRSQDILSALLSSSA
ncbi:MAG: serine hydrolase domain-containing protein [Steroidobacteraceae bacterium]